MWMNLMFSLLSLHYATPAALSDINPTEHLFVSCSKQFVAEGNPLECECQAQFPGSPPANFSLTWPGFSDNSKLTVTNVTRHDNGAVYTCHMTWGGHTRTVKHILDVAYGPDSEHTRIHGPVSFITSGTEYLNLTCESTEVNPWPLYSWNGVICHNDVTDHGLCVVKPLPPWDDGLEVICTVRGNGGYYSVVTSGYKLNLTYPPPYPPELRGYITGKFARVGDKIHCRVSGGKPLVTKVIFSCFSDPPHEDQEDVTEGSSVESSVTIRSVGVNAAYIMACVCSAVWEPKTDLYTINSTMTVFVDIDDEEHFTVAVIVAGAGVLLIVITAVAVAVLVKTRRNSKAALEVQTILEDCRNPMVPLNPGEAARLTPVVDDAIYTEIEMPCCEESVETKALNNSGTPSRNVDDYYGKVGLYEVSCSPTAQNVSHSNITFKLPQQIIKRKLRTGNKYQNGTIPSNDSYVTLEKMN